MTKRRKSKQQSLRKVIEVFCDGETEKQYIESIRSQLRYEFVTLNVSPKLKQADKYEKVFDDIRSLLEAKDHEQCILIFYITDMDTIHAQGKFHEYTQAKRKSLKSRNASGRVFIIETRPCFEFWLLLHFETISRQFNCCNDVIRELKKHWPNYTKTTKQVYDKLQDKLYTAISRSQSIKPAHSYSQMHILFEQLNEKFPDCRLT